jgi:hypothetical protein
VYDQEELISGLDGLEPPPAEDEEENKEDDESEDTGYDADEAEFNEKFEKLIRGRVLPDPAMPANLDERCALFVSYTCVLICFYTCIHNYVHTCVHAYSHTHNGCRNAANRSYFSTIQTTLCVYRGRRFSTISPYILRIC